MSQSNHQIQNSNQQPIIMDSYLYSSTQNRDIPEEILKKEWMMGIDEAGRGPVLGPMVYAAALCPIEFDKEINKLGFQDSKILSNQKRKELFNMIKNERFQNKIEFNYKVISSNEISKGMCKKIPYNLNAQAFEATKQIIQSSLNQLYNLKHIFVDTLGPSKTHQKNLENSFPGISFTVCSKADSIYPIVSIASVIAKVTRDFIIDNWIYNERSKNNKRKLNDQEDDDHIWNLPTGSGYPGDPNTINWLNQNFDPIFGFPQLARFSWQTVKTLLNDRGVRLEWNDEPATIQKWFKPDDQIQLNHHKIQKLYGIHSIDSL
ncbi:hypothetical protein CROQUDRAFT_71785 [Cronartium quercuum f. sp. fusiforme G11]|uniref:Ribonuclease n=1 Tax=Cronartium quercuum f. sp. fusiforme G11 TaxID=708437 RepID=A0A9P6TG26_9BASI|nr:hypothetical protein CROQUDRAFT_71785 [Cronartium quercuum f. sp. fusiforme G11]